MSVDVTNGSGCVSTTQIAALVPDVISGGTVNDPGSTICAGAAMPTLTSTASAVVSLFGMATAVPLYQWQFKLPADPGWTDIGLPTLTGVNLVTGTYTPAQTTVFRRVAFSSLLGISCDETPMTTGVITINVDTNRNPVITTPGGSLTICSSDPLTFTGQNGVGGDTFAWYRNNAVIAGQTLSTFTATPTSLISGDDIKFEITTPAGCIYDTTVRVIVNADPIPRLTTPSGAIICSGDTVVYTASNNGCLLYTSPSPRDS